MLYLSVEFSTRSTQKSILNSGKDRIDNKFTNQWTNCQTTGTPTNTQKNNRIEKSEKYRVYHKTNNKRVHKIKKSLNLISNEYYMLPFGSPFLASCVSRDCCLTARVPNLVTYYKSSFHRK